MQEFHQKFKKDKDYKIVRSFHERDISMKFVGKYHRLDVSDATLVNIEILKTHKIYTGKCFCSVKDQFIKKRGYSIALGRALKNAAKDMNLI
jgi:hypothetical protein